MITDRHFQSTNALLTANSGERRGPGRRKRNLATLQRYKVRDQSRLAIVIDDEIYDVIDADFDDLRCEPSTLLRVANQI